MDFGFRAAINESPPGEVRTRPYESRGMPNSNSFETTLNHIKDVEAYVFSRLEETFLIPESKVGLQGLLAELRVDLAELRKIFDVPAWVNSLESIRTKLIKVWRDDHVRDLGSLRSQKKNPLRDFLSPVQKSLSTDRHRAIRAARGLLAIKLLAAGEQITAELTSELKRWFEGAGPVSLVPESFQAHRLREIRQNYEIDSPTAKLIAHLIQSLEAKLNNPFENIKPSATLVAPKILEVDDEEDEQENISVADRIPADPLRGFLAEPGNAGVRVFSGVPLYAGMQPYELELTIPMVIDRWQSVCPDEGLAALLTLFTRVLPTRFSRIPLTVNEGAGILIDVAVGCVCVNLDEIISSHHKDKPFQRSPENRFIRIPLPEEIAKDLQNRAHLTTNPQNLDQLFHGGMADLAVSTKSMLRKLALTSHRPTLTHLSHTWARYVLSRCHDEAYASGIGIDFTVGTAANFNYFMMRKARLAEILGEAYGAIGFSGGLSPDTIQDVGSLRLPDENNVSAFLHAALREVNREIRRLARRVSKNKLFSTHNKIATRIYAVLKFLLGGRELTEETISRFRLDPVSGAVIQTDKRTSRYHERRLAMMCPTLRSWLNTYLSWLKLLVYRLNSMDRALANKIASVIDVSPECDVHPLLFRFDENDEAVPLGANDLAPIFQDNDIEGNGGRHFIDWLLRDAGLDSADVMGWMGRGNPGQESYGSWSTVIPLESLQKCADAIEKWLGTLSLPAVPKLSPRPLPFIAIKTRLSRYVPQLFQSTPDWSENHSRPAEPCPFVDGTVALASLYGKLFHHWRRQGPPAGWLGVALSLVIEDGVIHRGELEGVLEALQHGMLYRHEREIFIDCVPVSLGIRRTRLSETTIRLIYNIPASSQDTATLDNLESLLDEFLIKGFPEVKGRGFGFVMECASACYSIRIPGILYGWVRGLRCTRTSRPETVARHLLGLIEHPKFDVRRRQRLRPPRSPEKIRLALKKAAQKANGHKSHKRQIELLRNYLVAILPDFEEASREYVLTCYLLYLCQTQRNIFTIIRYEIGARRFLEKATDALAELGSSHVAWKVLVESCLKNDDGSVNESPDRTAINHALEWLGIDVRAYRRSGPPPAAFQYAEMPSPREGQIAIDLLLAQKHCVGDDWHLAAVALQLLFQDPHRWDAIANLRLCDLELESKHPHLVIAYEANGNLKSCNAPRVIELIDINLVAELKKICAQRAARFPNDSLVKLFGDDDHPRTTLTANRIHLLIGEALARATGSDVIRPHDTRDEVITRKTAALLNPFKGERPLQTLVARQGMFRITVVAGQSAPDVPMENYTHDFDVHRRKWVSKINGELDCPPSVEFLSKVTGMSSATYRQRICRKGASAFDMFDRFDPDSLPTTGVQLVQLSSLVVDGQDHIPWTPDFVGDDALSASAIYVGLRLLGESEDSSRLAAKVTLASAHNLEKGITQLNRRRASLLKARGDINRDGFLDSVMEGGLAIAMKAVSPGTVAINRLITAISKVGNPWDFANPEDILELKPWVGIWQANGIELAANLKPSSNSSMDNFILDRLSDLGIQRAKGLPARHFTRGIRATLKFTPETSSGVSTKPRTSPQISFLVSVCALAILLITHGEQT